MKGAQSSKRPAAGGLGAVLLAHNELIEHQGNALMAIAASLVGALSESGHLDAAKFKELLARSTVTIYGEAVPHARFLQITEAVSAFAKGNPTRG